MPGGEISSSTYTATVLAAHIKATSATPTAWPPFLPSTMSSLTTPETGYYSHGTTASVSFARTTGACPSDPARSRQQYGDTGVRQEHLRRPYVPGEPAFHLQMRADSTLSGEVNDKGQAEVLARYISPPVQFPRSRHHLWDRAPIAQATKFHTNVCTPISYETASSVIRHLSILFVGPRLAKGFSRLALPSRQAARCAIHECSFSICCGP
jgi:hypothetical protein